MGLCITDAGVLIDHLRGVPEATACLRTQVLEGHELWSITPVRTEILAGARPAELDRVRALFASLRWLDITPEIADRAGALAARFLRSHPGVDTVDYLLAAATELMEARLLTLNVKHFPMLPDLERAQGR